ncbi:histidine kinase [Hahella sp. SMD15-11]|uniref:Histidine kinase n=1 Tax=Thermohahella caldifontis TaxID=3142973 RepID=A0AB39UTE4_9GAMM
MTTGQLLPDLRGVQPLVLTILAAVLMAILFTLVHSGPGRFDWNYLSGTAIFMIWTGITGLWLLGGPLRGWLARRPLHRQGAWALVVLEAVTLTYALLADGMLQWAVSGRYGGPDGAFVLHVALVGLILFGLLMRYLYLGALARVQQQAALNARLDALQARIRPHFLFNSLNSIVSLISRAPAQAEEALLDLSELFRAALQESRTLVPASEELRLGRSYLNMEALRLGERLTLDWQVPALPPQARLPALSLQPLLENAIYHGIQPLPEGGTIRVQVEIRRGYLYVVISNTWRPEAAGETAGNRMAWGNIEARLQACFGPRAVLKQSQQGEWFTVTLRVPVNPEAD